jgi:hypothetical protein
MVLIDEKLLDNLWRKQDTSWKRPVDYKAKTILNSQLKTDLDEYSIPNDVKVKQYQKHLNRFLHTSRKQTVTPVAVVEPPEPEAVQRKTPKLNISKRKTLKRKTPQSEPKKKLEKSPRVKRLARKPLKFSWLPL